MEFKPHKYQVAAKQFALDHPRCMLALEMGLGKTAITLSVIAELLNDFAVNRVLVIAPKLVAMDVWSREVGKWDFCEGLTVDVAVGTEKKRISAIESSADIVCINRENVAWLVGYMGRHWNFDMVVIDESSSFKSGSSQRFKELRKVIPRVSRVIELTGTPRPRSIEDLWSQMYLLDRGERLGKSMSEFRRTYEQPLYQISAYTFKWGERPGASKVIQKRISDICMSMQAKDWLDVPEVVTVDHFVELPPKAMKEYKAFEREQVLMLEADNAVTAANAGVLTGKLCQFASGALYTEGEDVRDIHDVKLEALSEILEGTEEPVLIFYWFKFDQQRIKAMLGKDCVDTIDSQKTIADWNAGKIKYLLAQPASMGHGLNLQGGGHIMVWYGMPWSLEIYQQANARLHRQGQTQKVQMHRIIAKGTVDEDIAESLSNKSIGQDELIRAIKKRAENL